MKIAAILVVAGLAAAASAQHVEIGDAAALLPGQNTGSGALITITGELALGAADVDLYAINIVDFANFSATVASGFDSQLFLFNAAGLGVVANDDAIGANSRISSPLVNANGLYYIAISSYNIDPTSAGGFIFPNTPFTGNNGPTGPGGGSALTGWSGTGGAGTYEIRFTGTDAVPAPGALALLGLGGLFAGRRNRR
jgi:hypothetical protein